MARFISLFAGIGGFDLGMARAGHECVAMVEFDRAAAGVLAHRFPGVPILADVAQVQADDLPDADFITYGFPCQDLSMAGKRKGLDGDRSGLFFHATRLIRELGRRGLRIAVAENVAGLLSADHGGALARCCRELLDIGATDIGWRVLDSQWFGVAQRRRRVFLVADFGADGAGEVLALEEGMRGHPAPSRETGQGVAGTLAARSFVGGPGGRPEGHFQVARTLKASGGGIDREDGHTLLPSVYPTLDSQEGSKWGSNQWVDNGHAIVPPVPNTLTRRMHKGINSTLDEGQTPVAFSCKDYGNDAYKDISPTLRAMGHADSHSNGGGQVAVSVSENQRGEVVEAEVARSLGKKGGKPGKGYPAVREKMCVRRLTPTECERLQGFPDGWTTLRRHLVPDGNNGWLDSGRELVFQSDSARYKQLGNAVTVNVAYWLGLRINDFLSNPQPKEAS